MKSSLTSNDSNEVDERAWLTLRAIHHQLGNMIAAHDRENKLASQSPEALARVREELIDKLLAAVAQSKPKGIQRRSLQQLFWRFRAPVFDEALRSLCAPDGPLRMVRLGKQIWVVLSAELEEGGML